MLKRRLVKIHEPKTEDKIEHLILYTPLVSFPLCPHFFGMRNKFLKAIEEQIISGRWAMFI